MSEQTDPQVLITQSVAILIDGNNIERSIHELCGDKHTMINFDTLIPRLLDNRGLNRLVYFREGKQISEKLFGENPQTSGTLELLGNTITYEMSDSNVALTVVQADGSTTVVDIPIASFAF